MCDVRTVFTTSEVAEMLNLTPSYVLRLISTVDLSPSEFRKVGKRNCLFNETAVQKLKNRKNSM